MSLKNVDIGNALRRLADKRIEDAMKEGKFSNLSGAGKPIELDPMPAEENARLMWWALRILKQNDVVPDEVRWRKELDSLKSELSTTRSDKKMSLLVKRINELVKKINTLGTNAINVPATGVHEETERLKLQQRQAEPGFE